MALLVAFAVHDIELASFLAAYHMPPTQCAQFRHAQAGGIERVYDRMVARILRQHNHFQYGPLGQDALGDGAFCRWWEDGCKDVHGKETALIRKAVERFDRVDHAS